jgi:SNF2 family DNA or RNA helicase
MPTGSGKTLTALVLLKRALRNAVGFALVVAPAATLGQWHAEAERVAKGLDGATIEAVRYLHGRTKAATLREMAAPQPPRSSLQLALTTPSTLMELLQTLQGTERREVDEGYRQLVRAALRPGLFVGVVVDEVHKLKNGVFQGPDGLEMQPTFAAVYETLKTLIGHRAPRILLTATATSGSPADLLPVALLLFSGKSDEHAQKLLEADWRGQLQPELHRAVFAQIIQAPEDPQYSQDRVRIVEHLHPMTPSEAARYQPLHVAACEAAKAYERACLIAGRAPNPDRWRRRREAYHVMLAAIQKLRVFCASGVVGKAETPDSSFSKFDALRDVLSSPAYEKERVLVLTAFKQAAEALRGLLEPLGRPLFLYTGDLTQREREAVKGAFAASRRGILLATRGSMGVGVSLNTCQRAVLLDRDWTMANERQARGRIFRPAAGQDAAKGWVCTYLCFAPMTVEEWMKDRQLTKLSKIAKGATAAVGETVAEEDERNTRFPDLCGYSPEDGHVPAAAAKGGHLVF